MNKKLLEAASKMVIMDAIEKRHTDHIQASEELNIPVTQTKKLFKSNHQLTQTSTLLQIGLKTD